MHYIALFVICLLNKEFRILYKLKKEKFWETFDILLGSLKKNKKNKKTLNLFESLLELLFDLTIL